MAASASSLFGIGDKTDPFEPPPELSLLIAGTRLAEAAKAC
jgi:hypothetical protein